MKRSIAPALALLVAAGLAFARGGDAYLLFDVTTLDGDAIVEPHLGEDSARLTVSCLWIDGPGGNDPLAYGGSIIDILGDGPAATGAVASYTILNDLADIDPPGDTTIIDGADLLNVSTLQVAFLGYTDANPVGLVSFDWRTTDFAPRTITYRTDLARSLGVVGIIVSNPKGRPFVENWTGHDGAITFDVIPAPAAFATLILGSLTATRRRR